MVVNQGDLQIDQVDSRPLAVPMDVDYCIRENTDTDSEFRDSMQPAHRFKRTYHDPNWFFPPLMEDRSRFLLGESPYAVPESRRLGSDASRRRW